MIEPEPVVELHGDPDDDPAARVVVPSRAARHARRRPAPWVVLLAAVGVLAALGMMVVWLAGGERSAPMAMAEATVPAAVPPSRAGAPQACQTAVGHADAALRIAQQVERALRRHDLLMRRIDAGGVSQAEVRAGRVEVAQGVAAADRLDRRAAQFRAAAGACR
jgi:hypothetical protein